MRILLIYICATKAQILPFSSKTLLTGSPIDRDYLFTRRIFKHKLDRHGVEIMNKTSKNISDNVIAKNIIDNVTAKNIIDYVPAENIIDNVTAKNIIDNLTAKNIIDNVTAKNIIDNVTAENIIDNVTAKNIIDYVTAKNVIDNREKRISTSNFVDFPKISFDLCINVVPNDE